MKYTKNHLYEGMKFKIYRDWYITKVEGDTCYVDDTNSYCDTNAGYSITRVLEKFNSRDWIYLDKIPKKIELNYEIY